MSSGEILRCGVRYMVQEYKAAASLLRIYLIEQLKFREAHRNLVWGDTLPSPFAPGVSNLGGYVDRSDSARILQVASEQMIKEQVLHLDAAARDQLSTATPSASTPAAPHGSIAADTTLRTDATTDRQYYSLFKGPGVLTRPMVMDDNDTVSGPRTLTNVPSFAGNGVTFAWWHKHNTEDECRELDNVYCGLFFLYAKDAGGGVCWNLWLEANGIFFENKAGGVNYPRNFLPLEYSLTAKKVWRHVTFVLDESNDSGHPSSTTFPPVVSLLFPSLTLLIDTFLIDSTVELQ